MGKWIFHVIIPSDYPVDSFEGRKKFILSTTSWAGGKNQFLGIAYIVVGCLCILAGTIFFFIHLKYGKKFVLEFFNIGENCLKINNFILDSPRWQMFSGKFGFWWNYLNDILWLIDDEFELILWFVGLHWFVWMYWLTALLLFKM